MERFKSIIISLQGKNKTTLFDLYSVKHFSKSQTPFHTAEMKKKIYKYCNLQFYFGGSSHRSAEKLSLYIEIPKSLFYIDFSNKNILPMENYLLRLFSPVINSLSESYVNVDKSIREKAQFSAQTVNENSLKRNGMLYDETIESFIFNINFTVPLINGVSVNAKPAFKAIKAILESIEKIIVNFNKVECDQYIVTYSKQQQIRAYLAKNNLVAFIADGSILPRENGTSAPMKNAIPFKSPDSMRITIPFSDQTCISGMALKKGVTVITGGGYSGKSTLLDAIEMGIYDHIPGDGREFVITDNTALKIYAEDGRPVHNMDMSPFFKYLPNGIDTKEFSTLHASGSVSQAANIIEAVCGGSKLLLIDEDKSATNFMIRDENMRQVVKKEPIIPFTDRIRELYTEKNVSTILVIGGSSEYIRYADTIILMDDYFAENITALKKELNLLPMHSVEKNATWMEQRFLVPRKTNQPFLYFRSVASENAKKIILDEFSADITLLTALVSENQLNSLAYLMEQLLTDREADRAELIKVTDEIASIMYLPDINDRMLSYSFKIERWFEAVRPIDIFCCANRMRGLTFFSKKTDK